MGIVSFHEKYYLGKLEEYENRILSDAEIYDVKQLLKVLDDLTDEGYTSLNDALESDFSCLTRLRNILHKNGATPFSINHEKLPDTAYSSREYELEGLLKDLIVQAGKQGSTSSNPFLKEIHRYCEWIGQDDDTAYVFLLRDALLPYIFFRKRNVKNIYPWLISRRSLEDITKTDNVDEELRLPLYEALESGHIEFEDFFPFCKGRILKAMDNHQELKTILLGLLGSIKQSRIIVIESGYMGTIPMTLKSLDDRVDFRLYTTAPFLYETYQDKLFCKQYENLRSFETLYSQDLLLRYSSYHNGKFYVNMSEDESVKKKSFMEFGQN